MKFILRGLTIILMIFLIAFCLCDIKNEKNAKTEIRDSVTSFKTLSTNQDTDTLPVAKQYLNSKGILSSIY